MSRQIAVPTVERGRQRSQDTRPSRNLSPRYKSAPIIRVERPVHLKGENYFEWGEYLCDLAQANRHLQFKNLGGMACTHLESRDLNKMLFVKYPQEYADPKRTKKLHIAFAKSFQGFMSSSLRTLREGEIFTNLSEQRFFQPTEEALVLPPNPHQDLWSVSTLKVSPHFRTAGKGHSLVADLSSNEMLWEEHEAVLDFCKNAERLDTRLIDDQTFSPHLTIVGRAARSFEDVNVFLTEMPPAEIILGAPTMWHESRVNNPSNNPVLAPL